MLARHLVLSPATVSHWSTLMPHCFMLCFDVSLKRFFGTAVSLCPFWFGNDFRLDCVRIQKVGSKRRLGANWALIINGTVGVSVLTTQWERLRRFGRYLWNWLTGWFISNILHVSVLWLSSQLKNRTKNVRAHWRFVTTIPAQAAMFCIRPSRQSPLPNAHKWDKTN